MARLILFNKPCGVVCQFTAHSVHKCLKDFIPLPGFYPAGRLDADSEGLVVLTDTGKLQHRITDPRYKLPKTYWVQVEGVPDQTAITNLRQGVLLKNFKTQPAQIRLINEPDDLWPRSPPIRFRKNIPTSWMELIITEGRNRQVRRMTAAVLHPTLRLIRYAIGGYSIAGIAPGKWQLHHTTAEEFNKQNFASEFLS